MVEKFEFRVLGFRISIKASCWALRKFRFEAVSFCDNGLGFSIQD